MAAKVCIQCPVYNEPSVIYQLLEKIGRIRWPQSRLTIQILDDSTDQTTEMIQHWMEQNPTLATCMQHVRRPMREGYKAGSLAYGMRLVDADFFVIFDADFRPNPEYLERMMPHFNAKDVGAVQARWEFSNRSKSWITLLQSAVLDPHFHIEQTIRFENGYFMNFNGTAGIWRRTAIEDSGDWTAETVTEDLDLCLRAQIRGWRIHYETEYAVSSELPPTMTAFKTQQIRWTKGTVQVFRKLMLKALKSDKPLKAKLEAIHLLGIGFLHPFVALAAFTNLPHTFIQLKSPNLALGSLQMGMCLLTCSSALIYILLGNYAQYKSKAYTVIATLLAPIQISIGFAFSLTTSLASIQGIFEKGGEFVRTPKGDNAAITTSRLINKAKVKNWLIFFGELSLGTANLYFGIVLYKFGYTVPALFMLLQSFGLLTLSGTTIWERFLLQMLYKKRPSNTEKPQKMAPEELIGA